MTCTITGYLRDPAGVPLSDTAITITAQAITASGDGAMLPRQVGATTDAAGLLVVDLLPGRYMLRWRSATQDYASPLSVPDEPDADLADLLVAAPLPVRPAGAVVMPDRISARAYSAAHPGVLVAVAVGAGEPGAGYIGGVQVWDGASGPAPANFGFVTEGGDSVVTDGGDNLVWVM